LVDIAQIVEKIGELVDVSGVAVIIIGVVIVTINFVFRTAQGGIRDAYVGYRQGLGRALLLGLELLVAADIIRTVAVTPTLQSVTILAVIVVIRTFLSWSLELEIDGRWPWQRGTRNESGQTGEKTV
jgi:uncharacterized membrane protein